MEAEAPFKHEIIKDSDDVYILDCTTDIFVWYGPKSAKNKKKKATGMHPLLLYICYFVEILTVS